jgi:DNA polymerase III epsilon subunit-like protein
MLVSKVLWIDTETTGTDPVIHDVIQIGCVMELAGVPCFEREWKCAPINKEYVTEEILKFHGIKREDLLNLPDPRSVKNAFESFISSYVDKFNKQDKIVLAGFNTKFDYDMLRSWFGKLGDKYFGSWFFWSVIDVANELAKYAAYKGLRLRNMKLGTCCEHFGIPIRAHDALSDIKATRDLYLRLTRETI